jgi:hypothetical protein
LVAGASGFFSGTGSPVGNAAPLGSLYIDTQDGEVYEKFDVGNNDWEILSGSDNFDYWLIDKDLTVPSNQVMDVPFLVFAGGQLTINGILVIY